MKLAEYNKGHVAALAGAILTLVEYVAPMPPEVVDALQVILVTLLVVMIPNLAKSS